MNEKNEIHIPIHIINQIITVYLESEKLQNMLEVEPSDEEIARSLGWKDSIESKNGTDRVSKLKLIATNLMDQLNYSGNILDKLGREIMPIQENTASR
ncbi:MAG: hypothetical protein LBV20_04535 [Treponema sp.]|jgi:DNA-directed RNA polymerase sigma subunit (sigma70/sigma32)|nr:hypothetical protein [Treponema sp.]